MDVAFGYEDGEELGLDPSDAEPFLGSRQRVRVV
jgi:hypothetical protein